MGLKTLDLPPFDHILNTLDCIVHCGHPMRRQPVISEFEVAISKKCPMNPGFTLTKLAKSSFYKNATNGPTQAMRGNRCMEESTCHGMVIDQVVFIIVIYDLLVTYRECLFIFLHFFISFIHDFYVDAESVIDLVEREKCQ